MSRFKIPEPDLQIEFYHRLENIRRTYLLEALLSVVSKLDIFKIDQELKGLVSNSALQKMAGWGLRGETVFPVPYILKSQPALLGYYRLLLGFSQKQFYGDRYGFAAFKPMESSGRLTFTHVDSIHEFCQVLCGSAELLVAGIQELSQKNVHELTLLTIGPQLRGGVLNTLGSRAVTASDKTASEAVGLVLRLHCILLLSFTSKKPELGFDIFSNSYIVCEKHK